MDLEDLTVPITLDQMQLSVALAEIIISDEAKERSTKAKPLAAIHNEMGASIVLPSDQDQSFRLAALLAFMRTC